MPVQKNTRDGVLTISDNAGTPNSVTVDMMAEGIPVNYEVQTTEFMPRGKHASPPMLRITADSDATGSFSVAYTSLGTLPTLLQGGIPASWVPFNSANAEVPLWKLTLTIEGTTHGDANDSKCELAYTEFKNCSFQEGDPDTWTVNYVSHAKPVFSVVA